MKSGKRFRRIALLALLLAAALLLSACSAGTTETTKQKKENSSRAAVTETVRPTGAPTDAPEEPTEAPGPIIEPQRIADYLFEYGELPENFITKKEAKALGWKSGTNYLSDVAPGKSIGGDVFGNYEGRLPQDKGLKYHEADCWYTEGPRTSDRIIYSTDGRIWYTEDHYQTFVEMSPSEP